MEEPPASPLPGATTYAAFVVSDLVLLVVAWLIYDQAHRPMNGLEVGAVAACTAIGAWLGVWPFVLRFRVALSREERADLADAASQIRELETVVHRIELATGQWQTVQEHAGRSVEGAREIAERMTHEVRGFQTFMERAQNAEKQHLQLELTKLRRAEADWLQALVRTLDHVHALFTAARRSGQARLFEQITAFQEACRDAARRVGLVAHVVAPGTPFDPRQHQPFETDGPVPENAAVIETIGPGYTFQGQILRRPVVRAGIPASVPAPPAASVSGNATAFSSAPPASEPPPETASLSFPVSDVPPPAPPPDDNPATS